MQARMPMTYSISPYLRLLYVRTEGVVSQIERTQVLRTWLMDPDYPACDTALCDFTAAETTPTMADLRELVTIMAKHTERRGPKKIAMVTPKPIAFVVAREFRTFVETAAVGVEVRVFDAVEEAWGWLQPDQPRPD